MNHDNAHFLSTFLTALADPTRLRLLSLMAGDSASVGYLAESTGDSQPKVSRHLAYLRSADLVDTERQGKHIYYALKWPAHPVASKILSAIFDEATPEPRRIDHGASVIYEGTYTNSNVAEEMEIYLL